MAAQTHPSIKDGWFREINPQWPGQAMTIKVKQILHQEKSKYQDVLVFASETYGNVLILDGVIQATERDEFSYQEMIAHLPLASHPDPKHVLVIGGGDGGVVREVLKHASVEHVTLCDIDEAVVRVSKQFLPHMSAVFADPKVTVHIGDGFKFLPEHEDEYDVIITDSSDPVGPAAALFEAPYFSLLKKALKEGGNMSTQGECLWLHLPLIKELRETTKRLFPVAEYAYTTIPTYPSGQIGFVCCSKDSSRSVSTPLRPVPGCKYYNSDIHRAAFVLPEFGRAMIEDSKMILTDYAAGVRPGHKAEGQTSGKKVLLLGSGFVAAPCAEYVTKKGHSLTVACRTLATAEALCNGLDNASPATVDVNDPSALDAAIAKHDLVISLIPYTYHAAVIKSAIKHKKHVVTTSYVSPAMRELDAEAKAAGIVVMNEIGLDPGIDHLWAIKALTEVKKEGGKVRSFISMCGGLPSAQAADNALGYKLSWSARGVLLALRNNAKFLQDGRVVEVQGKDLMASAKPFHVKSAFNFVCYPNRDSVPFVEYYELKDAHTCIRGTLRFAGFPEVVLGLVEMNFLDDSPRDYLKEGTTATWVETTAEHLAAEPTEAGIIFKLKQLDAFKKDGPMIISKLRSLGLFSDRQITPRGNMLDTLCALLEKELAFGPDEVDLVMLQHKFEIENADGSFKTLTSTLEAYGEVSGHSAMAKTVGVPCGVAVDCILDGRISGAGVRAPYDEATCSLLRDELEKEGITMVEKIV